MAKLVEILARKLKEWPEAFGDVLGQRCDGTLHGYNDAGFTISIGETPQLTRCDNYMHNIVTRAEWQDAVDALKAKKAVEWDGAGLPPVGTICENVFPGEIWLEVIIIAHDGDMAVFRLNNSERLNYFGDTKQHFRPIRTPEQIAAEDREKAVGEMCRITDSHIRSTMGDAFRKIYDAGYRKQEPK